MMVKELSKSAIRLIVEYLPKVLKDPNNIQLRKKMFLGSLFSGLAFSNTRTTACHSISYPLTMRFGVDHGLACVITLSSVLEINKNYIEELDELYNALNIKDSNDLQSWLDYISKGIIDLKLSTFGIAKSDIKELASMSFTLGRMDNNPVLLNKKDVEEILRKLF
jgi:alcohol dehydrogenase class IV